MTSSTTRRCPDVLRLPAALIAAALLLTTGCSEVSSEKVKTNDLDATILVSGDESGINVSVTLNQNFHTSIDLVDGDVLVARSGDAETTLSGSGHYNGRLDVAPLPGTEVTVSLEREKEDDAPSSTVELPELVKVSTPTYGDAFDPGKELAITIDDAPGDSYVAWTGSCVTAGDTNTTPGPVSGRTITVPADAVELAANAPKRCTVEFEVIRNQEGSLDPAYDKGSITGRQTVTIALKRRPAPELSTPTPSPSPS